MPHDTPHDTPHPQSDEMSSDEALAACVQANASAGGEAARTAYAVLIQRYYPRVHAFLYRMSDGDRAFADDHTQETFLRAWRGIHTYQPTRPFRAWVFSIAANLARNDATRADSRHRAPEELSDDLPDEQWEDSHVLEGVLDNANATQSVRVALHALSPEQREVVMLYYYHDLPYAEIAAALHIPLGTVKTRLWAAVRRLRQHPLIAELMDTRVHG